MSESITNITVEALSSKEVKTKYGPKSTYSFKAGGTWFNNGWKKPTFIVGDILSFDYNESTYGKDVVNNSVKVTPRGVPVPPAQRAPNVQATSNKGSFPIPLLDGQRSIVRQNSVTNATKIVMDSGDYDTTEGVVPKVLEIAKLLEAYSCGDSDLAEAKKELGEMEIEHD